MLGALAIALACFATASAAGLVGRRAIPWVFGLTVLGGVVAGIAAIRILADGGSTETIIIPIGLPWLGAHFRIDSLSAFFVMVVNLAAALTAIYAIPYTRHELEAARILPLFPLFVAAMNLVLIADDAYMFLLSWEFMSLASWLLVLAAHRNKATTGAAFLYLIMASVGTGALLLAFGLLAGGAGSYAFDSFRGSHLDALRMIPVFALVMIGAGSKAGMVPLNVWLPPAHASAPSPVSALMSGVMTKVALYGLIRILFDLTAGGMEWWWGVVVVLFGGVTALTGILYAVVQSDIKRLLANSTVENVGIVLAGIGLALAFRAAHLDALSSLALAAALLHAFNHATFKSLLFLGAGAIITATGEQDMEKLGGLIDRMPRTAFAFLIGAVAISALPPLNGFASEWLIFQGIVNGSLLPDWPSKFAVPVVGAMLALAAALAAVSFIKVFGIVFLGRPRSDAARDAHEVGWLMVGPMGILALACVTVGILPKLVLDLIRPVTTALLSTGQRSVDSSDWVWLSPLGQDRSSYSGLVVFVVVAIMTGLLTLVIHRFASNRIRRSAPWDCGFPDLRPQTRYTASSFAQPIRRIFGTTAFAAREQIDMPRPGETRAARFDVTMRDPIWDGIYSPIAALVTWLANHLDVTQYLTIRRYLGLMFGALVVLLLVIAVTQ